MYRHRTVAVTLTVVLILSAFAPLGAAAADGQMETDDGLSITASQDGEPPFDPTDAREDDDGNGPTIDAFGQLVADFVTGDLSGDEPRGLQIAAFVLGHVPGSGNGHVGPPTHDGSNSSPNDDYTDDDGNYTGPGTVL